MTNLVLDETLSLARYLPNENGDRRVKRRQFLQTIGVVGIGFTLFPKELFAQSSEVGVWLDIVSHLTYSVTDCRQAAEITAQLASAPIYGAREATTFHDHFSAPYVFGRPTVGPRRVTCENGFEVVRLPRYDSQYPCRRVNDMNASEIIRVTDPDEIKRFGCVLTPDGERTPPSRYDHAKYRELAPRYGLDHTDWEVPYVRPLAGQGKKYIGIGISHKTKKVRGGKPMTDIIVTRDI